MASQYRKSVEKILQSTGTRLFMRDGALKSSFRSSVQARQFSAGASEQANAKDAWKQSSQDPSAKLYGSVVAVASVLALKSQADAHASEPTPVVQEENPYSLAGLKPSESFPSSIILYQYEVCPFCCKVKAFLDYHKIPYRVVEVDPLGKSELKWSEYKKVPVVLLDGKKQVNNSSSIISQLTIDLEASKNSKSSSSTWGMFSSKKGTDSDSVCESWRKWVDERLVRGITVNIYRNAKESFQTFDYITEHGNFGWIQRQAARVVGATMMWGLSNRLKKKYGIEGDVRNALYAMADEWVEGLNGKPFMGGLSPSLADIEAFGVIRSVVGTDTFHDLQHNTKISGWYERMMKEIGESARLSEV